MNRRSEDCNVYWPPTKDEIEKGLNPDVNYPYSHPDRLSDIGNVSRYYYYNEDNELQTVQIDRKALAIQLIMFQPFFK